jgi:hypothetical protein
MKLNSIFKLTFISILFLQSCFSERHLVGQGKFEKEARTVNAPFTKIRVECAANITLKQADTISIVAKDYENLLPHLRTEVKDSTLIIDYRDIHPIEWSGADLIINVPQITDIDISGKCNVMTKDSFNFENLEITASGVSNFTLKGKAKRVVIDVSGVGYAYLFELPCETAEIAISGTGRAEMNVAKNLTTEISGIGRVLYKGTPSVKKYTSGIGFVKRY